MSELTNIEWATSTGNPWIGCTKVSPGCKNCYAETLDVQRFSKTMGGGTKENPVSHWGPGAPRFRTKGFWKDVVKWNKAQQEWKNQPCDPKFRPAVDAHPNPRIFPSLCDWLDDEVPIEWLVDFLKLIRDTPCLDWLLLTKRPENFMTRLYAAKVYYEAKHGVDDFVKWICAWAILGEIQVPENVWIGTSVENQEYADKRIPELFKIPAKIRFLSVEPLLGPVDLWGARYKKPNGGQSGAVSSWNPSVDWVIIGGESGKNARPCNVGWIRDIVLQCNAASVPCFVKQLGSYSVFDYEPGVVQWAGKLNHKKGGDPAEWPEDLRVRQFPKKYELEHQRAG